MMEIPFEVPMSDPTRSYYQAALAALRYIEARKPTRRRFGPDAQARWSEFRGEMTDVERIDLMVRDADVQWPGALGARTVFDLRSVAEDEAFGPNWAGLDPVDAAELFRNAEREVPPADAIGALSRVAAAWGYQLTPVDAPRIAPADRLVVAGPSAVAAVMQQFLDGADLDWVDQVICVATSPAHRQIAAVAGALLDIAKRPPILSHRVRAAIKPGAKLISSSDAAPEDLEAVRELTQATC
jgi:hypothetical protein